MRANKNNEEELVRLRELAAHNTQQLDALRDQHEALRGELRVVRTERDLLKERLNAFMRRLFAAKSEARGTEHRIPLADVREARLVFRWDRTEGKK